jgi:hypothetical protein
MIDYTENGCSKQFHEGIAEQRRLSSHDSNCGMKDGIFCKNIQVKSVVSFYYAELSTLRLSRAIFFKKRYCIL